MKRELKEGVNLHLIPDKKFKTITIKINFSSQLSQENIAARALLANVLDSSSQAYPSQTALGEALSHLYGAGYSTTTSRKGNLSILSFNFTIPNPDYLPGADDLLAQLGHFMGEVIFRPHLEGEQFQQESFDLQKQNQLSELASYYDDKRLYALVKARSLYYTDDLQKMPNIGNEVLIQELTAQRLYEAYQEALNQDKIDILVIGDFQVDEMEKLFAGLPFSERSLAKRLSPFYENGPVESGQQVREEQKVSQAKLNLVYDSPIYYQQADYYAGLMFNGIFGGSSHSKLFTRVREEASLAYYVNSSFDAFTSMLVVQTGIDGKDASPAMSIIQDQLEAIQKGEISQEEMENTRLMFRNNWLSAEDSPSSKINIIYNRILLEEDYNLNENLNKLDKVTKEDVVELAQKIQFKASYLLEGEK